MGNKSIIYTAPRQSGKTTALIRLIAKDWINGIPVAVKVLNLMAVKYIQDGIRRYVRENYKGSKGLMLGVKPIVFSGYRLHEQKVHLRDIKVMYWDDFSQGFASEIHTDRELFRWIRHGGIRQIMVTTPSGKSDKMTDFVNNGRNNDFEYIHCQDMKDVI